MLTTTFAYWTCLSSVVLFRRNKELPFEQIPRMVAICQKAKVATSGRHCNQQTCGANTRDHTRPCMALSKLVGIFPGNQERRALELTTLKISRTESRIQNSEIDSKTQNI